MGSRHSLFRWVTRLLLVLVVGLGLLGGLAYLRSTNDCPAPGAVPAGPTMKAVLHCDFGSPDVLRITTVSRPVPTDSQVLVRVRASSINPADWHTMRGEPFIARPAMGWRKPAQIRFGIDFAGTIEAVGKAVTGLQVGDSVFGGATGALAEYLAVRASAVVTMPPGATFEQAAAMPVAATTALQGVRDQGQVRAGQRVLVNGASGGVGPYAVQIAKALGAVVTGVCSGRNVELVRSLGADRVIDYTTTDFTQDSARYDVIIDNVGDYSLSALARRLEPGGTYVMIGGRSGKWLAPMPRVAALMLRSRLGGPRMRFFIAKLNAPDLRALRDLMASGRLTSVIDRRYPLAQVREAVAYVEAGHARGKVIVTVE
jgi:NADPH:quinone reductase-like Zn-dependent oxidoreductase